MVYYAIKDLNVRYMDIDEENSNVLLFYKLLYFTVIDRQRIEAYYYALPNLKYNGENI